MRDPWHDHVRSAAASVDDRSVDAARRALDYLCLAQLYLHDNVLLSRPLEPGDVTDEPVGHWGTCPPVNAVLVALAPFARHLPGTDLRVIHGAGHAGPSALAHAWLTGRLAQLDDTFGLDLAGLTHLVSGFPHRNQFGGEITPLLPGHNYMGGQLGPAHAVAQGMALDAPDQLLVALIGDGECETGAAAASWLGTRALVGTGTHGRVLPVLMLNGMRMGGRSLLNGLAEEQIRQHFAALGYQAVVTQDGSTASVRQAIRDGLVGLRPLEHGPSTLVIVTVPKGHGAPSVVGKRRLAGTASLHKAPLRRPSHDPTELDALQKWLSSYRPHELFTSLGEPAAEVIKAIGCTQPTLAAAPASPRGCIAASSAVAQAARASQTDFGAAIENVLQAMHETYGLRVFSPDELASSRIRLGDPERRPDWMIEVLNEELCHLWAQGYQETGRRALVITYEAFAPIVASLLSQHLTYRRLAAHAGRPPMPSIVYLLTSLGWHNTTSHANPGLVDLALALRDPSIRVYTPADAARTAATLTLAVRKVGRCSLVVASKHPMPAHPLDTIEAELRDGYATWAHVGDADQPDIVLVSAGDIPARQLTAAANELRTRRPSAAIRYVHVNDLTCLGAPSIWPTAIPEETFNSLIPPDVPALVAVPCRPAPVLGLLAEREHVDQLAVRGWRDPDRPLGPDELLVHAGIDVAGLTSTAQQLLDREDRHVLEAVIS